MSSQRKLIPDANTVHQQRIASNPQNSAWVSANAGSGKTFVLSRRVVRLLLQNTDPSRILCLTFTKAAAGEMSNRVFELLGKWATMPVEELRIELSEVEGKLPTQKQLDNARTLFARALETPGGLKIQTIHAFCESLLHQFPLEANIPGNFTVMGDGEQVQLIEQARRSVVLESYENPKSPVAIAFSKLMVTATDDAIKKVLEEVISKRDELAEWLTKMGGPIAAEVAVKKRNQFSSDDTLETVQKSAIEATGFASLDLATLARVCVETGQTRAITIANNIQIFVEATSNEEKLDAIAAVVLKKDGKLWDFDKYPSKPVQEAMPDIRMSLEEIANRFLTERLRINSFQTIEHTTPLLEVAEAIITRYRQAKRQQGLLDYDDLIARTANLLTEESARQWVLYKLDLGIDHILLDEAQDTSPRQWQIMSSLVEEFFAGEGSRTLPRTVFAVGDEKQSIYSFQGAEPESFGRQRKAFRSKALGAERPFEDVSLSVSFRSTQDVLSAVDKVFSLPQHMDGLTSETSIPAHVATRINDPGSVEVWPLVVADKADETPDWQTPQSQSDSTHQAILLAQKIADQLKNWIGKERIEASGKLIGAGDILVLVRARDRFMVALNRALKDRGIAVAGADRLALTNHIAVQDLMALGQIMLTPEDDLSLAAVLKSPLIGLGEDQLYELARSRFHDKYEVGLFEALANIKGEAFTTAYEKLIQWRKRADASPPYEFYAQLLGADGGRKQFYSRLGAEAEDVLDAFLDLTLSHELSGLPGLQAFLETLASEAPEIKREMDQAAGQVRVMTIHAAKGLEAPIVFLIDKCSPAHIPNLASPLYHWSDDGSEEGYLWVPKSEGHGGITLALKQEQIRKSEQEYRRLLYVGMTRAEDRLIICGYHGKNAPKPPNWHGMVSMALEPDWEDVCDEQGALLYHRWRDPNNKSKTFTPIHHEGEAKDVPIRPHVLPAWIGHHLPKESDLPRPLSPSGAQALIDENLAEEKVIPSLLSDQDPQSNTDKVNSQSPRLRGTAIHALLQILPDMAEETRWDMAKNYLDKTLYDYTDQAREKMLEGVRQALISPELEPYLDPKTSRAEVPIMGRLDFAKGPRPISGTIDRLAVLDDVVMLIDYKTSPHVPKTQEDVPNDYITQMALYRALVEKLYSDKPIRTALVWTHAPEGPKVMVLPDKALDDALLKIAQL
ncbi:MAG: double-strand break repair helicase AddA [Rhizobiaceae bacterium]